MTSERDPLHPPAGRWTFGRKARLVQAVAAGKLTLGEIVAAGISVEEFEAWENAFAAGGFRALRVTWLERRRVRRGREAIRLALRELCADLGVAYMLSPEGTAITCGQCGMTSHNRLDVENRYCGHCKVFHDDREVEK